jgi:hypothetical protein
MTRFAAWLSHKFDIYLVDGIFNSLQNYALIFVVGLLLIIGGLLAIH